MAICDQFSNPRNSVIFCSNEVISGSNDVPRSEFLKYGQKFREKSHGAAEALRRCFKVFWLLQPITTLVRFFFSVPKFFYEFLVYSRTFDKILEVYEHTPGNGIKFRVFWPEIWTKSQILGKRNKPGPPNKIIFFCPRKKANFLFYNISSTVAHKARTRGPVSYTHLTLPTTPYV